MLVYPFAALDASTSLATPERPFIAETVLPAKLAAARGEALTRPDAIILAIRLANMFATALGEAATFFFARRFITLLANLRGSIDERSMRGGL